MRRIVVTSIVLCLVLVSALAEARAARSRRGATSGGRSGGATARRQADPRASAAQCDTPRGAAAFGSTARCLHALCAGQNVTNAYVLDGAHRLQRNPCAGVDPFDVGR